MKIKVKKLHPNAVIPSYATDGAACFDLYAATVSITSVSTAAKGALYPVIVVGTGLAFEIPRGYMMRIAPRSGLVLAHGIEAFPGVIDSDYRGEVMILLHYWHYSDDQPVPVKPGGRIAQAYICEVPRVEFEEAEDLTDTARGAGGFGSTGV